MLVLLLAMFMQLAPEPPGAPQFLGGTIRTKLTVVAPSTLQCASGMFCSIQLTTVEEHGATEWTAVGLPVGLDIFPDGVICGTPTCDGPDHCSFNVTITATEVRGIFAQ